MQFVDSSTEIEHPTLILQLRMPYIYAEAYYTHDIQMTFS